MNQDEYKDINKYKRYSGGELSPAGENVDYRGYERVKKEEPKVKKRKRVHQEKTDKVRAEEKVLEQERLREFADAQEMELDKFIDLSNLSIKRGETLLERINKAKTLSTKKLDKNPIELKDNDKKRLKDFIGKDKIDKEAAECLNKLANFNELDNARSEHLNDADQLDASRNAIQDAYDDKFIEDNFPDFGIDLILLLLYLIPKNTVIIFFTKLCEMTTGIFSKIGLFGLGKILVKMFKNIWNSSANCILEIIYLIFVVPMKRKMAKNLTQNMAGACANHKIDVCDDNPEDNYDMDIEDEVAAMYNSMYPDQAPDPDGKRCQEGYKPSTTERAIARELVEAGIREEQNAQKTRKVDDDDIKKKSGGNAFTNFSLLDRMQSDGNSMITTMKGTQKKMFTPKGNRIVDKVDSNILGVMANINGQLQRIDRAVTKVIALEFLSPQAKKWMCCIVRFLYIMLPRISHATGNKKIKPKLSTEDFEQFDLENYAFVDEVRAWIKIIEKLINTLLGTMSLNIDITGMMSIADMFINALKMSISEALSILTTSLYSKLKQGLFGTFNKLTTQFPDLAFAIESCPPFDWFMKSLECGLENLFSRLQMLLAQLWASSANQMKEFDMVIGISATNGSFKIMMDLLNILLKWDKALINFCSLNKTASEAEKEEIMQRLSKTLNKSETLDPKGLQNSAKIASSAKPAYSKQPFIGPSESSNKDDDEITIDQHTNASNPIYKSALDSLDELYGDKEPTDEKPEELKIEEPKEKIPTGKTWNVKEAMKSCGDEFTAILKDRSKDIAQSHNESADNIRKVAGKEPTSPENIPEFMKPKTDNLDTLEDVISELNKYWNIDEDNYYDPNNPINRQ